MKKLIIGRLVLSHLVVAGAAFHIGVATSASSCYSSILNESPLPLLLHPDRTLARGVTVTAHPSPSSISPVKASIAFNATSSLSEIFQKRSFSHSISKDFIHGMVWTPRNEFRQLYDVGYPLEPVMNAKQRRGNVMILYASKEARPNSYNTEEYLLSTMNDTNMATENCEEIQLLVTDHLPGKKCIALMQHWGPSANVHRFARNHKSHKMEYVSHFSEHHDAFHWNRKHPRRLTKEAWRNLAKYIQNYDSAMEELKPIADKVASTIPGANNKVIIVMVTNIARIEMLFNVVCAARKIDMDLSRVLVFALDKETYEFATNILGLNAYRNDKIFGSLPSGSEEKGIFGDMTFARTMIAKVYCVHMINELGYDVLFSDTDVVPLKPNILEYFYDRWKKEKFDMYFQYDKNPRHEQAPFSANSGFYFVKRNARTNYFFTMLVRLEDLILRVKSHQQVMMHLVSQFQSSDGLRVKVLGGEGEDHDAFPSKSFYIGHDMPNGSLINIFDYCLISIRWLARTEKQSLYKSLQERAGKTLYFSCKLEFQWKTKARPAEGSQVMVCEG
jgi:hypothetical protein